MNGWSLVRGSCKQEERDSQTCCPKMSVVFGEEDLSSAYS